MWDVDAVPDGPASAAAGLPAGSFLTCSSDGSVRLWALGPTPAEGAGDGEAVQPQRPPRSPGGGSALLRVVAAGRELQAVLLLDNASGRAGGIPPAAADAPAVPGDGCCGGEAGAEARCVRVSPDGRWIAVGDRAGNLRVHALAPNMELQVRALTLKSVVCTRNLFQSLESELAFDCPLNDAGAGFSGGPRF